MYEGGGEAIYLLSCVLGGMAFFAEAEQIQTWKWWGRTTLFWSVANIDFKNYLPINVGLAKWPTIWEIFTAAGAKVEVDSWYSSFVIAKFSRQILNKIIFYNHYDTVPAD